MRTHSSRPLFALGASVAVTLLLIASPSRAKSPFHVAGQYVEGCSCSVACPCDFTGPMEGCQGVGAMKISSGQYQGVSLAGVKIAMALEPAKWVRAYVDAPTPRQAAAANAFAKASLAGFGPVESVKPARIDFRGSAGRYTVAVNGGKTMTLTTSPLIGGNKKTAIAHTNLANPISSTMYQGKVVSGMYNDGDKQFSLKGTNSYFNHQMNAKGKA